MQQTLFKGTANEWNNKTKILFCWIAVCWHHRSGGIPAAEGFTHDEQAVLPSWSSGMTTLLSPSYVHQLRFAPAVSPLPPREGLGVGLGVTFLVVRNDDPPTMRHSLSFLVVRNDDPPIALLRASIEICPRCFSPPSVGMGWGVGLVCVGIYVLESLNCWKKLRGDGTGEGENRIRANERSNAGK